MTLLYTPVWLQPADSNVERAYHKWLVLSWLPGCLVSSGNPYVIRENVFGGFEVHIKLVPRYHEFDSGGWHHDAILEDYYATAPGSGVPINAGTVVRAHFFSADVSGSMIILNQAGSTDRLWLFRLPVTPLSPWYQEPPDDFPDRFCLQLPDVTTIIPMPVC